jgi:hypothetical protein
VEEGRTYVDKDVGPLRSPVLQDDVYLVLIWEESDEDDASGSLG